LTAESAAMSIGIVSHDTAEVPGPEVVLTRLGIPFFAGEVVRNNYILGTYF